MTTPKIGIIYLTYPVEKFKRDFAQALSSIEASNYPKEQLELICVESKAGSPSPKEWFEETFMAKSGKELPTIHYIHNDRPVGFAENHNIGLKKAIELGCEFVYLLNVDAWLDPDALRLSVERIQSDPSIAVVQSLMLLGEEPDKVNSVGNAYHYLGFGYARGYRWTRAQAEAFFKQERTHNPELEIAYASGAATLFRISAAMQPGIMFDDALFMYHEDTDLGLQMRSKGLKVVLEPKSIVYHHYEFGKRKSNFYWMERNRYVLMLSHYDVWTLLLVAPMALVMEAALVAFSIKNGWFDMKRKMYSELFTAKYWRWIGQRRRDIRATRVVSNKKLLANVQSEILFQEEGVHNPVLEYIGNPLLKCYWWVVSKLIF